jgi:hypothetical protein
MLVRRIDQAEKESRTWSLGISQKDLKKSWLFRTPMMPTILIADLGLFLRGPRDSFLKSAHI